MMGQLKTEEIEIILAKGLIGHLGCYDGQAVYVVPISYTYQDGYIYCHSHEGRKVEILRRNPQACFQVEHITNLGNWQSVMAQGRFEELTDPALRMDALQKLHDRHLPDVTSQTTMLTPEWPFGSKKLEDVEGVTFRMRLSDKTGRFERTHHTETAFF
jgi:nitroimidazol reductase NimA-like FMN-containing flavoprotein (pyridoxamine 5'-phosphate oxidase superfamily)